LEIDQKTKSMAGGFQIVETLRGVFVGQTPSTLSVGESKHPRSSVFICIANHQFLGAARRNSSGGLWNEEIHSGVGSCNHGGNDLAAYGCELIAMASGDLANEVVGPQ
jgi:hypothetical protein